MRGLLVLQPVKSPGQATPNLTAARRQDRSRRKTQSGPACESAVNVDRVRVHDQIPAPMPILSTGWGTCLPARATVIALLKRKAPRTRGLEQRRRRVDLGRQALGGMPLVVIGTRANRHRFARHIRHGHRAVDMGPGLYGRRCRRYGLRTVAPGLFVHA